MGGIPDWYVLVIFYTCLAAAPLAGPHGWDTWLASIISVACLASAIAFRVEIADSDAWGTGEPVPVTLPRYLWLQAHKLPILLLLIAGVAQWIWHHNGH